MIRKLSLSLDDLAVESFTPDADTRSPGGTVRAHQDTAVACYTDATGCAGSTCPIGWCDPWTGGTGETGDVECEVTLFGYKCDLLTRAC